MTYNVYNPYAHILKIILRNVGLYDDISFRTKYMELSKPILKS